MKALMPDPDAQPSSFKFLQRNKFMGVQRNVHISLKHHYVYVALPKVANSTIKGVLQQQELRGTNFEVKNIHNRLESPLVAPFQLTHEQFELLLNSQDVFRFAFVRNPYTRLLSCYLDRIQALKSVPRRQCAEILGRPVEAEITFADFIEAITLLDPLDMNEHFRPQWALASPDVIDYDFMGRFESFADDFRQVLERIWPSRASRIRTDLNLSPKITSAADLLEAHYTPQLARIVAEVYAEDFRLFDYDREML